MNGQSLTRTSSVLFYLLTLLASIIIVDAGKCSTTTTTITTRTFDINCIITPPPVITCPDCHEPHQNCGAGNGHQDGKHCIITSTCTRTETACAITA